MTSADGVEDDDNDSGDDAGDDIVTTIGRERGNCAARCGHALGDGSE